ncbi:uncharacterized protein LOC116941278 isoform X1 [Petromyzon marinus]|uniref:uncharacterized protein LOC116941278 isoform X1 n=1 Tax=Petromyzon marinus TaxID=7757 RepID=UPI003F6FA3D3
MENEECSSSDIQSVLSILDSRSPATQLLVKQAGLPQEPSEGRTALSFQILEELLPRLGVYGPVLRLLRDKLHDDVYSPQFTCDESDSRSAYSRIPYFILYSRLLANRNIEAEEIQGQLDRVTGELGEKCNEIRNLQLVVEDFAKKEECLTARITQLEGELAEKEKCMQSSRARFESELEESRADTGQCRDFLREANGQMQRLLGERRSLLQYREGIRKLEAAFQFPAEENNGSSSSEQPTSIRQAVLASKKNHLLSDIEMSRQLENQILPTRHQLMDEYEEYLDSQLRQWLTLGTQDVEALPENLDKVLPPLPDDDEGARKRGAFRGAAAELSLERGLLRRHRESLEQELSLLEDCAEQERQKHIMKLRATDSVGNLNPGAGAAETESGSPVELFADLLCAEERPLSRYAGTVLVSPDGGLTFRELPQATHCRSCAQRTLFCPHKLMPDHRVIQLPENCRCIMIARPSALIPAARSSAGGGGKSDGSPTGGSLPGQGASLAAAVTAADVAAPSEDRPPISGLTHRPLEDHQDESFECIWKEFKKRHQEISDLPRNITLERCLFLVEQFVATLLWNDDAGRAGAPSPSVLGCLWKFIAERYTDELEGEAAHHFLSAVMKHGTSNKLCRVFALALSGGLDGAAVRYASLLAEAAGCVACGGVVDFYELASALYPFLQEEDLDELVMGFVAFSENSFSERLVLEFLLQRVIGNADPAFAEWESRLAVHAGKGVGHMTVAELAGALEGSPLAGGEELWRHLMQQTAARLHSGNIPLQNVAQIMTYLSLLKEIPTLRGRFKQEHPGVGVEAERTVEGEEASLFSLEQDRGHPMTYSRLRRIGLHLARQREAIQT